MGPTVILDFVAKRKLLSCRQSKSGCPARIERSVSTFNFWLLNEEYSRCAGPLCRVRYLEDPTYISEEKTTF
jgi:hypothetical protein